VLFARWALSYIKDPVKLTSRSSLYRYFPGDLERGSTAIALYPEKVLISRLRYIRAELIHSVHVDRAAERWVREFEGDEDYQSYVEQLENQ